MLFCAEELYDAIRKRGHKVFTKLKRLPYPILVDTFQQSFPQLQASIGICLHPGPVFTLPLARLRMTNQEIVSNILHGFYDGVPHILLNSEKNTQVKHVSVKVGQSKLLELYKNDHLYPTVQP